MNDAMAKNEKIVEIAKWIYDKIRKTVCCQRHNRFIHIYKNNELVVMLSPQLDSVDVLHMIRKHSGGQGLRYKNSIPLDDNIRQNVVAEVVRQSQISQ